MRKSEIILSLLLIFAVMSAVFFGRKAFILDGERKQVWRTQYELNKEVQRATALCLQLEFAKLDWNVRQKPIFDSITNSLELEYDLIRSGDFKLLANKYSGGISLGGEN